MSVALTAWRAGRVRRWHTNPHLAASADYDDGHSWRVVVLALQLKPDLSRDAILYGIGHDAGEYAVGDISYDAKKYLPGVVKDTLAFIEDKARSDLGFPGCKPGDPEYRLIKICDWLDAWTWMRHHAPHLTDRDDWAAQLQSTISGAYEISVPIGRAVYDFVEAVREDT